MTPQFLTPTALERWRLVWWAAAFGVGAYAGYQISFSLTGPSSWGVVGLIAAGMFWVAWTVAFIAIPGLVAAFLYRTVFKGRLPEARTVVAFAALYAAGVEIGSVVTPALGLEQPNFQSREPAVLEAPGTMSLSLEGLAGYTARGEVLAECLSEPDGEGISLVTAPGVGAIDGIDVRVVTSGIELEPASVTLSPQPTAGSKLRSWSGPVEFVERTVGGRGGRITFVGAALEAGAPGEPAPEDWPTALSGTVTWSCGDWIGPVATLQPEPSS